MNKESIIKLQKIISLETERNYDNQSVMGGLDKVLSTWQAEARAEGVSEDLIEVVVTRLRGYPRLSVTSRQDTLNGILRRIEREGDDAPDSPALEPADRATPLDVSGDVSDQESVPESFSDGRIPEVKQSDPGAVEDSPSQATPVGSFSPVDSAPAGPPEAQILPSSDSEASIREAGARTEDSRDLGLLVDQPAALDAPLTVLKGVGERHAQTFSKIGLWTLGDLLYYLPRRYDDYTLVKTINRLWYGEEVTVIGTIQKVSARRLQNRSLTITEAVIVDGSGSLRVSWFNQPWIQKRLQIDTAVVLSGKIDQYLGRLTMNNPEWEPLEKENLHTNRIVPVYPLTGRITQRWLRRLMHQVVSYWAPRVRDPLPQFVQSEAGLLPLPEAIAQVHFPDDWDRLRSARSRLAFDEIFLLQMGVLRQKKEWEQLSARVITVPDEWIDSQLSRLPYHLTRAQQQALGDIRRDLASGHPMNRLLQGDVGSGKTVIAAIGIAIVASLGYQAAMMAPSSILAEQHYLNLLELLTGEGGVLERDQIRLLLGDTPEAEKQNIRQSLASGEIRLVVGTHALIEDPIEFKDLEMVIIDEQHRFGVKQRAALRAKGTNPHLLVMTATPIPRSLALTVYGDLDLTVMDEMPPGRKPVSTHILFPRERERAYALIKSQVEAGRQAFIIYPLVEESESSDSKAAVEEFQRLQEDVFPELRLGLLHGRLKGEEKESVMTRFKDNDFQVLIATSVVEVGIDIPNATVMVIEGANRFGLAQLHQFRGRVGRGYDNSYCLLIPESQEEAENSRLAAMTETNDGFVLAEKDLDLRGPGDFLGSRQSGFVELKLASLTDVRLIEKARRFAMAVFEADSELASPENASLLQAVERFWSDGKGDIS